MGMEQHPIEGLMKTAMESIKDIVDVNTVVGDPVQAPDGTLIIPISKVALGFAAGGGEFEVSGGGEESVFPFGGGSGAGVSVAPLGFLVVGQGKVRLLPLDTNMVAERLIDLAPQIMDKLEQIMKHKSDK